MPKSTSSLLAIGFAAACALAACGGSTNTEVSGSGSASSGTGTGGSTGGSSTGRAGTTTGVCVGRPDAGEHSTCTTDSQCACGLSCIDDPLAGGNNCETDCQATSDCNSLTEVCQQGSCRENFCGGFGNSNGQFAGPCDINDAGDGYCNPLFQGGETVGICQVAGTAAIGAACAINPTPSTGLSQICGPNAFCRGTCTEACDPLNFDTCGPGMVCVGLGSQNSQHFGTCHPGTVFDAGYAAPYLPPPTLPSNGGSVIAKPKLVTMSFQGYQDGGFPVSTYADWIVGSNWLKQVGSDYGVSNGTHPQDFVIPGKAPAQVQDLSIRAMLASWIADGGVPAPDSSTIYMVYYPQSTTITLSQGSVGCQSFGGYHEHFNLPNGTPVTYGVVATCAQQTGLTIPQSVDVTTSHELVEAATDPDPEGIDGNPGFRFNDLTMPWSNTLAEAADLCEGSLGTYDNFIAQRIWSNTAARAGAGSPCVPVPAGEVYINASVLPNETQVVPVSSAAQTVTFQVTPYSFSSTSDWVLVASTLAGTFNPGIELTGGTALATNVIKVNNGDPVTLQVTIPPGQGKGSYTGIQLASDPNQSLLTFTSWTVSVIVL